MYYVSKTDRRFIELARLQAGSSTVDRAQLGCIAVVNGGIVGTGYNNYRTRSKDGLMTGCSCHAEMQALHRASTHINRSRCNLFQLIKGSVQAMVP
jgi:deoxycytidylate deaminase